MPHLFIDNKKLCIINRKILRDLTMQQVWSTVILTAYIFTFNWDDL